MTTSELMTPKQVRWILFGLLTVSIPLPHMLFGGHTAFLSAMGMLLLALSRSVPGEGAGVALMAAQALGYFVLLWGAAYGAAAWVNRAHRHRRALLGALILAIVAAGFVPVCTLPGTSGIVGAYFTYPFLLLFFALSLGGSM